MEREGRREPTLARHEEKVCQVCRLLWSTHLFFVASKRGFPSPRAGVLQRRNRQKPQAQDGSDPTHEAWHGEGVPSPAPFLERLDCTVQRCARIDAAPRLRGQ